MYKARVNDLFDFEIESKNGETIINKQVENFDIVPIKDGSFHVLYNQKSYNATLIELNKAEKLLTISINGNFYTIALKDRLDLLLQQLGMADLATQKVNDLKAPMPGKVLEVLAQVGAVIKKGDALLILEAMKMENLLKAAGDGTVKEIKVLKGDVVEKNAVLIVME